MAPASARSRVRPREAMSRSQTFLIAGRRRASRRTRSNFCRPRRVRPILVIQVLLPPGRVGAHRLQVAAFVRTDPHVLPGGRDRQRTDPLPRRVVADGLAVRVDVGESAPLPPPRDARSGASHPLERAHRSLPSLAGSSKFTLDTFVGAAQHPLRRAVSRCRHDGIPSLAPHHVKRRGRDGRRLGTLFIMTTSGAAGPEGRCPVCGKGTLADIDFGGDDAVPGSREPTGGHLHLRARGPASSPRGRRHGPSRRRAEDLGGGDGAQPRRGGRRRRGRLRDPENG